MVVISKNEDSHSKMKAALEWSQYFPHCKSMGTFSDALGQLTRMWPKFELIQAHMAVLLTCKNEEDLIKMKVHKSRNNIIHRFFRCSMQLRSQ